MYLATQPAMWSLEQHAASHLQTKYQPINQSISMLFWRLLYRRVYVCVVIVALTKPICVLPLGYPCQVNFDGFFDLTCLCLVQISSLT